VDPRCRDEGVAPDRHRLPRRLRGPAAPLLHRPWGLQGADGGGAGPPQHLAFAPLAQLVAKLRLATQLIIPWHPAMGHLRPPRRTPFQARRVPCLIAHRLRHVAGRASWRIPCPGLRQGQAEVEHGRLRATDLAQKDADLALVPLAPMTTPVALDAHRGGASFGNTAGIEGADAIRFAQLLDDWSHPHVHQRALIPGRRAEEGLDAQALDIDSGGKRLGMLAVQRRPETCQREGHVALAGFSLESRWIGHDEIAQTVPHVREHVGGNDAGTQ
jgi:hypothetical protein